jgi:hypothetical protein
MQEASAFDAKARYAARRVGLHARKCRSRRGSIDNFGGFMLIEPNRNMIVAGERFNLKPEDVIAICKEY